MNMETGSSPSAAENAYASLRGDILNGALAPNTRLTEMMIADRLGLSRTPVREAIKRLIMEGFVSRAPGEGLRVVGLRADEIEQIFQARLMLETYATRRAAQFATQEQICELHVLADVITACTPPRDDADLKQLSECNAQFHSRIMEAAKAPRIRNMLAAAINLGLVLRTYRLYSERDLIRSSRHHHEIAEAIEARAPEWAASVMASHLQAALAVAMRGTDRKSCP